MNTLHRNLVAEIGDNLINAYITLLLIFGSATSKTFILWQDLILNF